MEETIISYKVAKLAKEKEFNEPNGTFAYNLEGDKSISIYSTFNYSEEKYPIIPSTQSLLQKWLREVHKIHIDIGWMPDFNEVDIPFKSIKYWIMWSKLGIPSADEDSKEGFNTYEEALEEGLLKALELI